MNNRLLYIYMRKKDDLKQQAIINAVITQTNELGFVNISMSKIAKAAGISTSTLYIYYKNKEEMFEEIYKDCKRTMLEEVNKNLNISNNTKAEIFKFCQNIVDFMNDNLDTAMFLEQATNSPVLRPHLEPEEQYELSKSVYDIFTKGIEDGSLKNINVNILIGFCMYPITSFYKEVYQNKELEKEINYELIFNMCYDAIKK